MELVPGETDWVSPSHQAGDCPDLQVFPKPKEGRVCVKGGRDGGRRLVLCPIRRGSFVVYV